MIKFVLSLQLVHALEADMLNVSRGHKSFVKIFSSTEWSTLDDSHSVASCQVTYLAYVGFIAVNFIVIRPTLSFHGS